jgi:ribose transport system permease protein
MADVSLGEKLLGFLARNTVLIVLVGLIIIFSIATPRVFLSGENISNVARQVSFDSIIALGEVIVLISGGIDLSVGSVLAMAVATTVGLQGYGVPVAIALTLLMGIGVGLVNGLLVTKLRIVPFIATLGTMEVVYGAMLTYTGERPIPGRVDWFASISNGTWGPVPIPTVIMLALLIIFQLMLTSSPFGHHMFAVGSNAEAARMSGIRIDRNRIGAYILSGFCAALAGVLLASLMNSSSTQVGLETPLFVIAGCVMGGASILGGRGSAIGAFMGVLALAILENGMALLSVFTYNQLAVRAVIFVLVVAIDAFYYTTVRRRLGAASGAG